MANSPSNSTLCGENSAAAMHARYVAGLVRFAHRRIAPKLRAKLDPEDVVQSVFRTYFRRRAEGKLAVDSGSLWCLLATITARKCCNKANAFRFDKRDVDREATSAEFGSSDGRGIVGREPSPEDVAVFQDTLDTLLAELDSVQREVVLLRMSQYTVREIAEKIDRTERTVHRALARVRKQLERMEGREQ